MNETKTIANNTIQVFIIKEVERKDKAEFEKTYQKFIGSKSSSLTNSLNSFFQQGALGKDTSVFLTPLIYDMPTFNGKINCNLVPFEVPQTSPDIYFKSYTTNNNIEYQKLSNDMVYNGLNVSLSRSVYINLDLINLTNCPLLDYTKLYYVFKLYGQNSNGIGDIINFNIDITALGQSSGSIRIMNIDNKYNLSNEVYDYSKYTKAAFETNDIIIIRAEKRLGSNNFTGSLIQSFTDTKSINNDEIDNDPYKTIPTDNNLRTIFTGYINNVDKTKDYQSGNSDLSLRVVGPSKKLEWIRVLTGQAAMPYDAGAALHPLSVFEYPQTLSDNSKPELKNDEIVKNLIVKTYSSINNIKSIGEIKDNFYKVYTENINNTNDNKKWTSINEMRNKYQSDIYKYLPKFYTKSDNGYISIYKNSFTISQGKTEPCFRIKGSNQPAYQLTFANFNNIFQANFTTAYQFIRELADRMNFNFYDDPYGSIVIEPIDFSLSHLQDSNTVYMLNNVTSFANQNNVEGLVNILLCYAQPPLEALGDSWANIGFGGISMDYNTIEKYGEKVGNPIALQDIYDRKVLANYSRNLMERMNSKAFENISINMLGNPLITVGHYAYYEPEQKMFYIESINHAWTALGDYAIAISGAYVRDIIGRIDEIISDPYSKISNGKLEYIKGLSETAKFNLVKKLINDKLKDDTSTSFTKRIQNIFTDEVLGGSANYISPEIAVSQGLNIKDDTNSARYKILQILKKVFNEDLNNLDNYIRLLNTYTNNNIRNCYAQGFFWKIMPNNYPYESAKDLEVYNKQVKEVKRKLELLKQKQLKKIEEENKKLNTTINNSK